MKKILIIEDDVVTRNTYTRILEGDGFSIVTADSGPGGVELALRERPNMVFLDLGLPSPNPGSRVEFDGLSVLSWLRRSPLTRGIPVAVVSAWPAHKVREATRRAGAEVFLQKPARAEDLTSTARMLTDDNDRA
jgi:twitching motility two-component system response regulator PilH